VEGFLPIFFLAVVLKIPIGLMLYLVWWALHAEPEPEEAPPEAEDHRFHRWRREPKRPRDPRRGPHAPDAQPLPDCPPGGRSRSQAANAFSRSAIRSSAASIPHESRIRSGATAAAEPSTD
jgi:hypothetical protein